MTRAIHRNDSRHSLNGREKRFSPSGHPPALDVIPNAAMNAAMNVVMNAATNAVMNVVMNAVMNAVIGFRRRKLHQSE